MAGLRQQGLIDDWHDRDIPPGGDWDEEIRCNLEAADLILLLVSSDFIASSYCMDIETARALERAEADEATVIPIFWREFERDGLSFANLQGTPKDMHWINQQTHPDKAWAEVVRTIRRAAEAKLQGQQPDPALSQSEGLTDSGTAGSISSRKTGSMKALLAAIVGLLVAAAGWYFWPGGKQTLPAAESLLQQGEYESAQQHCEKAPASSARDRCLRIASLMTEKRNYEQFYADAENAPDQAYALTIMGEAEIAQRDYGAALTHLQHAIALNPDIAQAYMGMGQLHHEQGQAIEALPWYQQAVERAPRNRRFLHNLAAVYAELGQLPQAETQYRALLDVDNSQLLAWAELIEVLKRQGKQDEARSLAQQTQQALAQNPEWKNLPLNAQTWFVLENGKAVYLQSWQDKQQWLDSVFEL